MTLWNELGGRSWSAGAGPRSAAAEPRRRTGRRRQLARSRRAYPPATAVGALETVEDQVEPAGRRR
jgi:hypothetical protein